MTNNCIISKAGIGAVAATKAQTVPTGTIVGIIGANLRVRQNSDAQMRNNTRATDRARTHPRPATTTHSIFKRLRAGLFICAIFCAATFTANAQSGTTGSLQWSISDGTLTISGEGAMPDYGFNAPPWLDYSDAITKVIIGDGITTIGGAAFGDCWLLTEVTIPNSATTIGDRAFSHCISLTGVTFPNSVTTIGQSAFSDCRHLTEVSIPNSVTTIGYGAFVDCYNLTEVTIGNSVTTIGDMAFSHCISLNAINVDEGNTNFSSLGGVLFNNKNQTTLIQYPGGKRGRYTISSSVTTIGNGAFSGCESLTAVNIPNSVTAIGNGAFSICSSLTKVTIPNSVTTIEYNTFSSCSSLTKVTIPNSVTTIGQSAFSGCSRLTKIKVGTRNPNYSSLDGVLFDKNRTTLIQYPCGKQGRYTIPSSVTTIGDRAFYGCSGLTSVTIGNSVRTIEDYAFYNCRSLYEVTIGNSVTNIGNYAFYYCESLSSVTVHWTVPLSINNSVFQSCETTTVLLIVPQGTEAVYSTATVWTDFYIQGVSKPPVGGICGDNLTWSYDVVSATLTINGTGDMYNYNSSSPPWYNFRTKIRTLDLTDGMATIGQSAFYGCNRLTEVTIPNSVTTIGQSAFSGCSRLIEVTIPNSVTTIGNGTFLGCERLTAIIVDEGNTNFSSLGGVLFDKNQTTLIQYPGGKQGGYIIPNSVTIIERIAFGRCSRLTEVIIPNSVTTIGDMAFSGCSRLTEVTIPNSVTTIGDDAFEVCSSMTEVTIPNSVTIIGYGVFTNCSLTEVTIPNSVTTIGDWAFAGCRSLTAIINHASTPQAIDTYTFDHVPKNICTLYVPDASVGAYRTAAGWREFKNIVASSRLLNAVVSVFISDLNIYPNPFTDAVRITGVAAETRGHAPLLKVINAAGAVVHTQMITSADETIPLEHLPAGVYFFLFEKDGKTKTVRVVKN